MLDLEQAVARSGARTQSPKELRRESVGPGAVFGVAAILAGLIVALVINHHRLYPDFNLLPGDRGDTRLVIFTLEHWFRVLKGQEPFYVLGMFFPERHALGYADGLFLFALPYATLRTLGLDYFTSYQLLIVGMTIAGYAAWLLLLKEALRLRLGFAIVAAVMLTSLNALQVQAQIGKLTAFHAYPVLIGLLVLWMRPNGRRAWTSWASALLFSILLGLLFFTSYYPAWFLVFTLLLFGLVAGAASCDWHGAGETASRVFHFIRGHRWQLLAGAGVLLLSLIPFAVTYAPLIAAKASRNFNLVLQFSPRPLDIANVSPNNYLWAPLLQLAGFRFGNLEVQMGSPLLVLMLFLAAYASQLISIVRGGAHSLAGRRGFVFLLSTTALIIFALIVRVRALSLWYVIYEVVPGASALRALGRYMIVIDIIMVVATTWWLDEMYVRLRRDPRHRWYLRAGLALLCAALVVEEANGTAYRLDKQQQLSFLAGYHQPVPSCRAFFIANPEQEDLPVGYYGLDAMMIAMKLGIPTVNGYSGFAPDPAFELVPRGPEYEYRIREWLRATGASQGICELDMQSAAFRQVNVAAELPLYQEEYRSSLLDAFSTLYSAASRFVADGQGLSDLYPQFLEERGYLDPHFGYGSGARYKWMDDRYWIGARPCPKQACLGIGVVGQFADLQEIIRKYGPGAETILFPEPERLNADSPPPAAAQGELLLIFSTRRLIP